MPWILALAALALQQPAEPSLLFYRFWRAPNMTSVTGVIAAPLAGLTFTPAPLGRAQTSTYGIEVEFRDAAAGTVLRRESWFRRVSLPQGTISPTAQAVETISFDLAPGRYTVRVVLTDSVTGATAAAERLLAVTGERPPTSDLVLASDLRPLAQGETAPHGTFVRNGLVITPNLSGVVAGDRPALGLFTEVYPPEGAEGDTALVSLVLRRAEGTGPAQERLVGRRVYPAGGGVETMHVPLDGVQPGEYRIGVKVAFPDTTITVEREFRVPGASRLAAASLFANLDAAALDSIFEVSSYVAEQQEVELFKGLDVEGKRRFLDRFWARRDPTPGGPNEAYEEYMARVAYANREFAERQSRQPGWKTARGRIYIVYGPPAERFTPQQLGRSAEDRRFEVWKYAGGRNDKYVFFDEHNNDVFHLIYSTNPRELSDPNFEARYPGLADLVRRM
jgi:GWxTD domain-containing protein